MLFHIDLAVLQTFNFSKTDDCNSIIDQLPLKLFVKHQEEHL